MQYFDYFVIHSLYSVYLNSSCICIFIWILKQLIIFCWTDEIYKCIFLYINYSYTAYINYEWKLESIVRLFNNVPYQRWTCFWKIHSSLVMKYSILIMDVLFKYKFTPTMQVNREFFQFLQKQKSRIPVQLCTVRYNLSNANKLLAC